MIEKDTNLLLLLIVLVNQYVSFVHVMVEQDVHGHFMVMEVLHGGEVIGWNLCM